MELVENPPETLLNSKRRERHLKAVMEVLRKLGALTISVNESARGGLTQPYSYD